MEASHNELSLSILQRQHGSIPLVVIGLNLFGHKRYTTILLHNVPHTSCKISEFTFQSTKKFFEQNVLLCNVVEWIRGDNIVS